MIKNHFNNFISKNYDLSKDTNTRIDLLSNIE